MHQPWSALLVLTIEESPHALSGTLAHRIWQRHDGSLTAETHTLAQTGHERRTARAGLAMAFNLVACGPVELPVQIAGDVREDRRAFR